MAESVAEVIARLKAQKTSQKSEIKEVPKAKPKDEDEDFEDTFDETENKSQEKAVERQAFTKNTSHQENPTDKQEDIHSEEEKVAMQIELLQNDGRFRAELLYQYQKINENLTAIAGILVDIHGKIN